ncbi:ribonuclease P protein component [Bacillaceae bacterium W0354]
MRKEYRIKRNEDFQYIIKKGQSFANRELVLYYIKREQDHFRVGLSVSKKLGNAVKRNQIKRYIRHAFIELDGQIKPNYDFIVIARKPTASMSFHEVKRSLSHLLMKTNMFTAN